MALCIKSDVDLKELEKFGFRPKYDQDTGELIELYRIQGHYVGEKEKRRQSTTITKKENFSKSPKNFWQILNGKNKYICPYSWGVRLDVEDYEILYDLIKAGLVEKIND